MIKGRPFYLIRLEVCSILETLPALFKLSEARMRNYLLHLICHKGYKPKYYNPLVDCKIEEHHVARFYGVHMARMLRGFPTIEET
eukprot:scaffold63911_cov67-Cyclotella_meneghiniana.AAC.4